MPQVDAEVVEVDETQMVGSDAAERTPPRWPQFTLRTLLGAMTGLCVVLAVMSALGMRWSLLLLWVAVLILAHVFANSWSGKAGRRRKADASLPDDGERPAAGADPASACAPSTRLRERIAPGRSMRIATIAGAVVGAGLGTFLLWGPQADWVAYVGTALGIASSGGVGAFLGFLTSSFLDAAFRALREAERHAPRM